MKCVFCNKDFDKSLSFKNIFSFNKEDYCKECKEKLSLKICKYKSYTLYYFSDYSFVKDKIYSIKYFGDVKKAESFKSILNNFFKTHSFDLVLIAPSNKTREAIRGFNHVKLISDIATIPYKDVFIEPYRIKQSKLTHKRKLHNFSLKDDCINAILNAKSIIIIDDIFTSGKTLEALASTLSNTNENLDITFLTLTKTEK